MSRMYPNVQNTVRVSKSSPLSWHMIPRTCTTHQEHDTGIETTNTQPIWLICWVNKTTFPVGSNLYSLYLKAKKSLRTSSYFQWWPGKKHKLLEGKGERVQDTKLYKNKSMLGVKWYMTWHKLKMKKQKSYCFSPTHHPHLSNHGPILKTSLLDSEEKYLIQTSPLTSVTIKNLPIYLWPEILKSGSKTKVDQPLYSML